MAGLEKGKGESHTRMNWNSIDPRLLKKKKKKVCACKKAREHLLHGWAQLGSVLIIKGSGVQLFLKWKCASDPEGGQGWVNLQSCTENSGEMTERLFDAWRCFGKVCISGSDPKHFFSPISHQMSVCGCHIGPQLGKTLFMCVYVHVFRECEMPVSISALLHWVRLAAGAQSGGLPVWQGSKHTHTCIHKHQHK